MRLIGCGKPVPYINTCENTKNRALTKLKSLNIENNYLYSLKQISTLKNLQTLSAGKNNLGATPPPSPKKAVVHQKQSETKKDPLPDLPISLKQIKLDSNQFEFIPKQIMSSSLTKLVTLDLSNNNIASVPPMIGVLTSLTELNLSHNLIPRLV